MKATKKQAGKRSARGVGAGGGAAPKRAHIAPMLGRLAAHFEDAGEAAQAVREYRALVSVARAAQRWVDCETLQDTGPATEAMVRGLRRLSRAGGADR